jgi:hypothetical protein
MRADRDDTMPNPIAEADREEWASALHGLSEIERAQGCKHQYGRRGRCMFCGESADE